MTQTAAYNANEVAAVYMSLNRDDLLSVEEGGQRLGKDASLQNGFYGLSDPLNLRGVLESFEGDFSQGSKSCSYKVRILNPTTELENILIGFYSQVFPANSSVFNTFEDATERQKRMNRAYEITGDQTSAFATSGANTVKAQFPIIYLRFGYGTNANEGLSRIHKAQVFDIKYIIQDNRDKMIELNAVDQFTFTNQNPSFNKRPYRARVKISEEVQDGSFSLKLPSEILSNVITEYLNVFQQCVPYIDLSYYKDDIDNLVFSYAARLAEADYITKTQLALKDEGVVIDNPEPKPLTSAEKEAIKNLLDRPLTTHANVDRGVNGVITPSILFISYKEVFNQIGLKWELNPVGAPKPITGPLSAEQLTPLNTPIGGSAAKNAQGKVGDSVIGLDTEVLNLKTEFLHEPPLNGDVRTKISGVTNSNRLSFWPMALEDSPRQTESEEDAGQVLGNISKIETYGEIQVTQSWAGLPDSAGCPSFNPGPPPVNGCGTQGVPGKPALTTVTKKGLVVHFRESAEQIRAAAKPITRSYYNNTATRFNQQGSITPVNNEYDTQQQLYHPPQWYAYGSDTPTEQNNDPIKIKIVNVQGTVPLNNEDFYLYEADSDGSNGSKFLLVKEKPGLSAYNELEWVNNDGTEFFPDYEGGGVILIADSPLRAPQPESGRAIRPLTVEEKKVATEQGIAPLWLDAGYMNISHHTLGVAIADDENYKYSFTVGDIKSSVNAQQTLDARLAMRGSATAGDGNLPPLNVNFPVSDNQKPIGNVPLMGPSTSVKRMRTDVITIGEEGPVGESLTIPLLDLETQDYFDITKYNDLPRRSSWQNWANWATLNQVDTAKAFNTGDHDGIVRSDERGLNPYPLQLEPTTETSFYLLDLATNLQAKKDELQAFAEAEQLRLEQEALEAENAQKTPEEIERDAFIREVGRYQNAYVTMADDGAHPHISSFLETTLNNINRLVVGRNSKMRVQQIQVNMLSPEDKKKLKQLTPGFQTVNWDSDEFALKDKTLLILAPGDTIDTNFTKNLIRPVKSFPQTFDASAGNSVIYLDYGTPNSIVAKVDFTGDNRVLVNLAQQHYSVRQFNDIKALFDGMETFNRDMLTNAISDILADRIRLLSEKKINTATLKRDQEELASLRRQRETVIQSTQIENGQVRSGKSTALINDDILKMLPTLIDAYDEPSELANVLGKSTAEDILKIASVVDDPAMLELIFPDANVDGQNNTTKNETFEILDGVPPRKETQGTVLRRRVDFDSIRARISEKDRIDKMQDMKFNFDKAMSQEVFNLNITTLGIPEIDEPASEFLTRRVFFKFYDPRLASGELHWLSGAYQIIGFKHRINPTQGFLTELNLVRDVTVNINEVRDLRV